MEPAPPSRSSPTEPERGPSAEPSRPSGGVAFAIVDAFVTAAPTSGNPAGVVILEEPRADAVLQSIATELNQAETAFVVPRADGSFSLRWFTPRAEVALCGHATLAAAHHLRREGRVAPDQRLRFETLSGELAAEGAGERLAIELPEVPAVPVEAPAALHEALGGAAAPRWVGCTQQPEIEERNFLVVLDDEEAVRSARPRPSAIEALPAGGLIVTAAGRAADIVSRYFAPAFGIPEDPVTGSAHCTLAPYWRPTLGGELHALQLSLRGGELRVTSAGDGRVRLEGATRTALQGEFSAEWLGTGATI